MGLGWREKGLGLHLAEDPCCYFYIASELRRVSTHPGINSTLYPMTVPSRTRNAGCATVVRVVGLSIAFTDHSINFDDADQPVRPHPTQAWLSLHLLAINKLLKGSTRQNYGCCHDSSPSCDHTCRLPQDRLSYTDHPRRCHQTDSSRSLGMPTSVGCRNVFSKTERQC